MLAVGVTSGVLVMITITVGGRFSLAGVGGATCLTAQASVMPSVMKIDKIYFVLMENLLPEIK